MSLFSAVELAPRDPILGLNEAFNADTRTTKVNLGVGVYFNEEGKIPLLRAVRDAEKARVEAALPRGYLPIEGIAAYDAAVQKLLLGNDSPLIAAGPRGDGAGAGRHGRAEDRRRLPEAPESRRARSRSATRAGKTTARCSKSAGFEVVELPVLRRSTPTA